MTRWTQIKLGLALMLGRFSGWGMCANRHWCQAATKNLEITITFKNPREPDGYAREDLVRMLHLVREHQKLQGWTEYERFYAEPDTPLSLTKEQFDRRDRFPRSDWKAVIARICLHTGADITMRQAYEKLKAEDEELKG